MTMRRGRGRGAFPCLCLVRALLERLDVVIEALNPASRRGLKVVAPVADDLPPGVWRLTETNCPFGVL